MKAFGQRAARAIGPALNTLGGALLLAGAALGWLAPALARMNLPAGLDVLAARLVQPLDTRHIDVSAYLGADITALAVIIAVVIGFNITILQIAGQAHSLGLVRGILATLSPFLLCWSVTTAVALTYFLVPPLTMGQLWQQLAWFGAVVLLMIGYLWNLPWRLSGDYVARWALRGLRGRPVADWPAIEGYAVIQTAVAAAAARGDLGTARAITLRVGRFLLRARDRRAEAENTYHRGRYRALKNLLSGCAQSAGQAPNAVAYYLGYVQAGALLQAVADGHPTDDPQHDLFSGALRAIRGTPEHVNPLWTGMRHALCRPGDGGPPYLLEYWLEHDAWPEDDPRRVTRIAAALARSHAACWETLRATLPAAEARSQAAEMAADLYRDLVEHLGPVVARARHRTAAVRLTDLPLSLLDATQAGIMRDWPATSGEGEARVAVVNAYEQQRGRLGAVV
jgi:hypothetical protein